MEGRYRRSLSDAKEAATRSICNLAKNDRDGKPLCDGEAMHWVASAVDTLNKAWQDLLDCVDRQCEERGGKVLDLLDELAEAKADA